jgi:pimeloyl-ACP methyl ester carboxylesterase
MAKESPRISHHTARIKDIRMHYTMAGEGPPVLLLHGWPHHSYGWRHVQELMADDYTTIAPDLRGQGYSSKTEGGYDADNLADDFYQLVQHLGCDKVFLVGHDWGSVWAYHYAAQHRDEVEALVNFEMMIPGTGGHEEGMIPKPNGEFFWHMGWHSVPEIPEALIRGKERMYLTYYYENFAYNPTAIDLDALDEFVHCMTLIGALRAGLKIYQEFWTHSKQAKKHIGDGMLEIPVMAYGGEALMGGLCVESMQKLATNVEGGSVPLSGHWVAEERPDFVAEKLIEFFDKVRKG